MGWAVGFDSTWGRDVGYGVPALCDYPGCVAEIDRGLSYVCGGEPYGGEHGCGLYFCQDHMLGRRPRGREDDVQNCYRCRHYRPSFKPKPDVPQWINWKLTDDSWRQWRKENAAEVAKLHQALDELLVAYVGVGA